MYSEINNTMVKSVELQNIYSLKNYLNCGPFQKMINEYFRKKTHTSTINEYRPNSENWLKAKSLDEEISKIPDHKVNFNYDTIKIKYNYHEIQFNIGTITVTKSEYCDMEERYVQKEVTLNFLVENSHWGHGLICNFDELIVHHRIQNLLENMLDDQRMEQWRKHLDSINHGVFMLLLNKIVKAEKELIPVNIFTKTFDSNDVWVQIGEQKYHIKEMIEINLAYENNDYAFYDENDRKIEYKDYYYDSFPDFYLKHTTKK